MGGLESGHVTCGPVRGLEKKCMGRGHTHRLTYKQTDKQTNGHRDSMTESAQWADSVKKGVELFGQGSVINGAYPV